jgi:hypothetical protein
VIATIAQPQHEPPLPRLKPILASSFPADEAGETALHQVQTDKAVRPGTTRNKDRAALPAEGQESTTKKPAMMRIAPRSMVIDVPF